MSIHLTDSEITQLMAEPKPLDRNFRTRFQMKPKRGHGERELDVQIRIGE